MVSAHAERPQQTERRPAPSSNALSLRLDELQAQDESLRRVLQGVPPDSPQVGQLSADLLVIEAEKLSLEAALRL